MQSNSLSADKKPNGRGKWELKFATRIALIFGFLGFMALVVSMAYSVRTAEISLQSEIENSLFQRHRTAQTILENRLNLLEVYLHTAASNRIFTSLAGQDAEFDTVAEDMIFMFQDSAMGAILDVFFLLDYSGNLVMDAGLPLYDITPVLTKMRSPVHYTNTWHVVTSDDLTLMLKAVPIFDPATIQLRGYMFAGLAIGQNRSFLRALTDRADLDYLAVGSERRLKNYYSKLETGAFHTDEPVEMSLLRYHDGVYLMRKQMKLDNNTYPLWIEFGVSEERFVSATENYWQSFFLLSGGFLFLLFVAAWLLHLSHDQAIGKLIKYIQAIQQGVRGAHFTTTGVYEYNQVGEAMQRMVEDLNIAATVFESAEGMMVTDKDKIILRVNQAFTDITGYSPYEVVGQHLEIIRSRKHDQQFYENMNEALEEDGAWQGEMWNVRKSGEEYLQWTSISAVMNDTEDSIINYVVTLVDVTQRKAAETKIRQLAFYDQLTDLPNRQLLMERLVKSLLASSRNEHYGAILYIDLDDFKTLNDTRGHDMGDRLLKMVAERLLACVRRNDTVSRIGGDEFIILLEDLGKNQEAASKQADALSRKLLETLARPYSFEDLEHFSTLSIGITLFHGENESVDDLLKQADLAMYQAKASGRNTHRFFNPDMQAKVLEHAALANDIRQALVRDEFVLYFQPQVNHRDQLIGAEVLLRWTHPEKGMISPVEFIPVAEDTGLILPLGEWVIDNACKELALWSSQPESRHLVLAVNISAKQFHQADFVELVLSSIRRYGTNPARLKLEITESMLLEDLDDTIKKMTQLQVHGVSFALDDFGTGYSSLSYLKRLPLDQLKIDKSFVRDLLTDTHDADIARTIVSLAKSMNLSVIAEGVETEEQRSRLASYGCLAYQGYLFGRPVPIEKLQLVRHSFSGLE